MSTKIDIKHNNATGIVPTTSSLNLGEIAINTYDGKVFIKKDNGTPSIVEIGGGGASGVSQILTGSGITISPSTGTGIVTISSTGGAGTPGGLNTQVQFNNSGAFGGSSGLTFNSGSNTLTLTGLLSITGSQTITGSLTVTQNISASSFTGSLLGTSSYATTSSYALTASNILGGANNYIPLWSGSTTLSSSVMYQNNGNIGIGTTSPGVTLHVASGTGSMGLNTYETIVAERNADTKLGVYSSTNTFSPAIGTSIALGYSNVTASSTYYPGFEMQMIGNVTESQNKLRFNYIQRKIAGTVAGGYLELLNIYPDARVTLAPTSVGAIPRLIIGYTSSIYNLDVSGSANISNGLTVTGSLTVTQNISANSFTGSLLGTATTASYVTGSIFTNGNNAASASYAKDFDDYDYLLSTNFRNLYNY